MYSSIPKLRSANASDNFTMKFFDSHAHYYDERFEAEFPGGAAAAIEASVKAGAVGIINCGTNPVTNRQSTDLTKQYPGLMFAAVGLHPEDLADIPENEVASVLDSVEEMTALPAVCAIGEIGLDYHFEQTDAGRARQKEVFDAQLSLAERLGVPVIIHDRDAHGDIFDIVRAHPSVRGVFHSYSGSAEMARDLVRRGWHISFSGTVSFKNARSVKEAAAAVPHDRLLVETDCPYLAPHPFRGSINSSALLPFTIASLAEVCGMTDEEVAALTMQNTLDLFNISLTDH